jgi:hypothetical protein
MNIFELTKILNESNTKLATQVTNDILEYDTNIEQSSTPIEKRKKDVFLQKVSNIINDKKDEKSIRNVIFNFLNDRGFIPKTGKTRYGSEVIIKDILHNMESSDLEVLQKCLNGENKLKLNGSILNDIGFVRTTTRQLRDFRPSGCGPWEVLLGICFNGFKAKRGGDVTIEGVTYEVKLSGSGYIDNKKLMSKVFQKTEENILKQYLNQKPNILLIDNFGNYIVINYSNYEHLLKNNIIQFVKKTSGSDTDFGNLSLKYNTRTTV